MMLYDHFLRDVKSATKVELNDEKMFLYIEGVSLDDWYEFQANYKSAPGARSPGTKTYREPFHAKQKGNGLLVYNPEEVMTRIH